MTQRPLVLVVDDEQEILDTIRRRLVLEGIAVELCLDPGEAVERMRAGLYPIVISDIKMPGMSGTELLLELKRVNPLCNVIMMTGYSSMANVVDCLGQGAADYFVKPLTDLDALVASIQQALARVARWKQAMPVKTLEGN